MVGAFDEVDKMFADVELFLQIYPGDENIEKASIKLIADTLWAAENVIGFFLKGTGTLIAQAAFPALMQRRPGLIVLISSTNRDEISWSHGASR